TSFVISNPADYHLDVVVVPKALAYSVDQRGEQASIVGQIRARIAGQTQESLSEMSAITQETLSVSGILLAKTYSRQSAEVERYAQENSHQISLQVRQAMSGQLFFAVIQVF